MADKDARVDILVGAYTDKKNIENTVKELNENVSRALKDGYIEVPVELKTDVKRGSSEVLKAQSKLLEKWEKQAKKGFSSSKKELTEFVNAALRFRRAMNKEEKHDSPQAQWMQDSGFNDLIDSYNTKLKDLRVQLKDINKQIKAINGTAKKTTISSVRKSDKKGYDRFGEELARGASRAKAATPGAPTNLGVRGSVMDGPYVDKRSIINSDRYGAYRDPAAPAKEAAQKAYQKELNADPEKNKTYQATEEQLRELSKQVEKKLGKYKSEEIKTIQTKMIEEVKDLQSKLEKSTAKATGKGLVESTLRRLVYDQQNNIDPLKTVFDISGGLTARYDAAVKKSKLGATKGRS